MQSISFSNRKACMTISSEILERCREGDRQAQFVFYEHYFSMLMGICMRYRSNEQDARSLLNLGFYKIFKALKKYEPDAPLEPWMRRIVINTAIDDYRKNRKRKESTRYTDFEEVYDADPVDWPLAEHKLAAEDIMELLDILPPVTKTVFNLFAIDGYEHKEIGKKLDMSPNTSKWHVHEARKKLQDALVKLGLAHKKMKA